MNEGTLDGAQWEITQPPSAGRIMEIEKMENAHDRNVLVRCAQ
jgi:hypothetical protein